MQLKNILFLNEKSVLYFFRDYLRIEKKTKLTNKFDPFYNFALFANTNKSFYNKPYFIRIGGIFLTIIILLRTHLHLIKIFDSIDKSNGTIFISEFTKI